MSHAQIVITAAPGTLDDTQLQYWKDEGFTVEFVEFSDILKLKHDLDALLTKREKYGMIAYGDAASAVKRFLEASNENANDCCAAIFFDDEDPDSDPVPGTLSEISLRQGVGSMRNTWCRAYSYPEVRPGFAQMNHGNYDKAAEKLAWTRSLQHMREKLGIKQPDLEAIWMEHLELEFETKDADATMKTMVPEPYVNHIPTLTGGIGHRALRRFYADFFIPNNPADLRVRLLSRTVGTDRVVDEMYFTFTHTCEIPWMLPGVGPTGKPVEVILVSVVCIRGGKLYHEHIYWDQATVLVQIGMLDPMLVPEGIEAKRLPVVDASGARKVVDEGSVVSNELIAGW